MPITPSSEKSSDGRPDIGPDIGRNGGPSDGPVRPEKMTLEMPVGNDPASVRKRLEAMEQLLERSFTLPGTKYPIGLDSIVGLVPVIGDFITAAMGAWLVWEAKNLGLPKWKLWRMAGHIAVDTGLGAVPLVGDAFDLIYRSNTKNLRIVKKHLDKHHPATRVIEG